MAELDFLELSQRMAVALAIGVLIGLERGWHGREEAEGQRVAGMRTFALIGLLGAGSALLALHLGDIFLGFAFASVAVVMTLFRLRAAAETRDYGATTIMAGLLTFALGALAMRGELGLAASVGVVAALLLGVKPGLHRLLLKIDYEELLAVLKLLAMSVVLLPVLPNRGYGPWQMLNPYEVWLMVVLICSISFVGYLGIRILGEKRGVTLAALAGGLISSTAVAISLSRMARQNSDHGQLLAGGITLASAVMYLRTLIVIGVFGQALLPLAVVPLCLAAAVGGLAALLIGSRSAGGTAVGGLELRNPFDFWMAVKFGLLLAAVMLLSRALQEWLGDVGLLILAVLSGLADVDAVTLTVTRLTPDEVGLRVGVIAILLACAANTVLKATISMVNGRRTIALPICLGFGGQLLAIAIGIWLVAAVGVPFQVLEG